MRGRSAHDTPSGQTPEDVLSQYAKTLEKLRPGDIGQISLEPWMGPGSSRRRLRTVAHRLGLELVFSRSLDPRQLIFRVKELPPDTPAPQPTLIGPPPPPKKKPARSTKPRTYVFDLSPYEDILANAKPDDKFEIELGTASPDVIKYRMFLVAKRYDLKLEFKARPRRKLEVIVHERRWRPKKNIRKSTS